MNAKALRAQALEANAKVSRATRSRTPGGGPRLKIHLTTTDATKMGLLQELAADLGGELTFSAPGEAVIDVLRTARPRAGRPEWFNPGDENGTPVIGPADASKGQRSGFLPELGETVEVLATIPMAGPRLKNVTGAFSAPQLRTEHV